MTTIANLVDKISTRMHSFTGIHEQVTYLASPVTETETVLQVGNGARVSIGIIEVDDELMLVDAVEGNEVRLLPFGRGRNGSTAASHATNAMVTNDPLLPRQDIFDAICETLNQIHPDLFAVKTTDITYQPARLTYELPADADRVLQVTGDIPGPSGLWGKVTGWQFERSAAVSEYPSGRALNLFDSITPGYKLHVTYAAPYGTPASMSDSLESLGVQDGVREVVTLGACWRLVQSLEPARLQLQAVEQLAREQAVPAGAATNLAKQLWAMFDLRKKEERARLIALNPLQIHRTR